MIERKFNICYLVFLLILIVYFLLDTFVITKVYEVVSKDDGYENKSSDITIMDNYYKDDNIEITIKEYREYDSNIYVADVYLNDSKYLQTAFAKDSYGKNVTEKTSTIASNNNAILAINGDYYGVQEKGFVLRNGTVYRNTSSGKDALVIYKDGSFEVINEDDTLLEDLLNNGAYNVLSFGPVLVEDNLVSVTENDEVDRAMASNPRTSIGIIDENHYVFVVSDGRVSESAGLSLYDLATFMKNLGCKIAYNLDGGGSSTMYFNGEIINNPTTNGKISERSVSDIVYIGY